MDVSRLWDRIQSANDTSRVGLVSLNITRSDDNNIKLEKKFKSRGSSVRNAMSFSESIKYSYTQADSLLLFNETFRIPKDEKWHGQNVHLELQIPEGTIIKMRRNMGDIIYDIDNVQDMDDDEMPSHVWMMKQDGLTCLDCGSDQHDWNKNPVRHHQEHQIHQQHHGRWEWHWND